MNKIIVIVGPTGVGKTKLSIELAASLNGEIINADSMQIYKGLDIGTAKITEKEKNGIPHHLFDIKNVTDNYSVFDYQSDARKTIEDIYSRNKTPIMVGGTGLYIKAVLFDYRFIDESINNNYNNLSNEELYNKIKEYDESIDIHINNRKRMIRALNSILNNSYNKDMFGNNMVYDAILIGLTTNREELYNRINNRVDLMVKDGLIDEVKSYYNRGIKSKALMTGIGYKELYSYFDGDISLEEAVELIKKNSRHYAKRQYTWFNNQMDITWFDVDFNNFDNTVNKIIEYIKSKND